MLPLQDEVWGARLELKARSEVNKNNCAISVEELAIAKRNALETTSRWESRAEHAGA